MILEETVSTDAPMHSSSNESTTATTPPQGNNQMESESTTTTTTTTTEPVVDTQTASSSASVTPTPQNTEPAVEATTTTTTTTETPAAAAQTTSESSSSTAPSSFTTPEDREAATQFLINFVGATCTVFTLANTNERRIAIEALRMSDHVRASLELQAATADESAMNYPQNYVFLDGHVVEIPTGIDPSFLSALPDSLRREVIVEQLRIQGIDIRNRPIPESAAPTTTATTTPAAAAATSTAAATTSNSTQPAATSSSSIEINPEFLAALPPQIQQELLTQQRIEQQARAAAETAAAATTATTSGTAPGTSGTTAAVVAVAAGEDDNAAFMRALPASLRQAILFDMDHSQISALPEDLANEARALQQQQQRDREIDLFSAHRSGNRFGGGGGGGGNYTSRGFRISSNRGIEGIYNVASSLLHDSYLYGGSGGGGGGIGAGRDLRLRRSFRHLNDGGEIILGHGAIPGGFGSLLGGGGGSGGAGGSGLTGAHSALAGAGGLGLERVRTGRQLLDHESIACLLVLLFIDDPRMNMTKLQRVVRNLCIHSPSRAWIIKGSVRFDYFNSNIKPSIILFLFISFIVYTRESIG